MKHILIAFLLLLLHKIDAQNQYIDTSFGTHNGYTLSSATLNTFSFTNLLEHNNQIYGLLLEGQGNNYLYKYSMNGILDTTFGSNGFSTINNQNNTVHDFDFQRIKKIVSTADNKLLILNGASALNNQQIQVNLATKINLDGSIDLNYGVNGHVLSPLLIKISIIGTYKNVQDDVLLICRQKTSQTNSQEDLVIIKIDSNGNFDSSFGINGTVNLPNGLEQDVPNYAIFKNQSIYIHFTDSSTSSFIKKFDLLTLSYDLEFGNNGTLSNENNFPYSLGSTFTIDDNNAIFTAGNDYSDASGNNPIYVLKFTNEILDTSFGTNGIVQMATNFSSNSVYSITQYNNKLVIQGEKENVNNNFSTSFFAQLNVDGSIDSNFGQNGIIANEFIEHNLSFDYIYSENSIISGGFIELDWLAKPCLVKYLTNNNLSTNNTNSNTFFSYYPNPTTNELYFKTDENVSKVFIYDVLGRLVKSANVTLNRTDLSDLNSGAYIIKAQSDKNLHTFKLVKQ